MGQIHVLELTVVRMTNDIIVPGWCLSVAYIELVLTKSWHHLCTAHCSLMDNVSSMYYRTAQNFR